MTSREREEEARGVDVGKGFGSSGRREKRVDEISVLTVVLMTSFMYYGADALCR